MRFTKIHSILLIGLFISFTCVAMAYTGGEKAAGGVPAHSASTPASTPPPFAGKHGIHFSGFLTQSKVHVGGAGNVGLTLQLEADPLEKVKQEIQAQKGGVDLVIVLDRSGSMQGRKMAYAKQAIIDLVSRLTEQDRFAMVSYSDTIIRHSMLLPGSRTNKDVLNSMVLGLQAAGKTNLGGGLREGVSVLSNSEEIGNTGKVILISDGLANVGIVSPERLGDIAAGAVRKEFGVSTVGVGDEFNELLMTAIADQGGGTYYYLDNPAYLAGAFMEEFNATRTTVARALEIRIPLPSGFRLTHAAGYPITHENRYAVFRPGDIIAGQRRTLHLTLQAPTHAVAEYTITGVQARYLEDGRHVEKHLKQRFTIACVDDRGEAVASIDKGAWEKKVLQEDYSRLKEEVAKDVKAGNEQQAMQRIQKYRDEMNDLNSTVESEAVAKNLDNDLGQLRQDVQETFAAAPAVAEQKKKALSKSLQHEGYLERRSKK